MGPENNKDIIVYLDGKPFKGLQDGLPEITYLGEGAPCGINTLGAEEVSLEISLQLENTEELYEETKRTFQKLWAHFNNVINSPLGELLKESWALTLASYGKPRLFHIYRYTKKARIRKKQMMRIAHWCWEE